MQNGDIKKVLIVRFGAIGDVLHTSEIFRSIKRKYPDTVIHYLTTSIPAQIIEYDTDIDKILILKEKSYKYLWTLAKKLKQEKYDLIINLQNSNRSKFLCFFTFPKKTVTYKKTFKLHAVENFWATAQKFYKDLDLKHELELKIPQEIIEKVKNYIPDNKKIVTINIFTSSTRQGRRWRKEYFKQLTLKLINELDCYILFTGSKDDAPDLFDFQDLHSNIKILAGKLSLMESCALYSLSDVVISGDTGPLHLASATNKPVCIGLYGAAPIPRTGVWGCKHYNISANLPCVPCNKRKCKFKTGEHNPCMDAIKPDTIFEIIKNDIFKKVNNKE